MTIAFVFAPHAWEEPRARWTLATLAPLLDAPWRALVEGGEPPRADEVVVFVGEPEFAPACAAVVVAAGDWPALRAASLERAEILGAAIPAPEGRLTGGNSRVLPYEWLPTLWHVLAREEEREDPRRDQWKCFSGAYTRLATIGLLETAWVDDAVTMLRDKLDDWCDSRGSALESVPRWKDGAPFAVALSHDVDDVRLHSKRQAMRLLMTARSPMSYAVRGGLTALVNSRAPGPDPYSQFERWAAEETRRGFRSTFFVFARPSHAHEYDALYTLEDPVVFEGSTVGVGAMFRTLAERGFEVGLHGSYRSWRDSTALGEQRAELEEAVGAEVRVTRQHFLRLDPQATWDAQEDAGFTTDATLGYNEAVGFRAGIAAPFHPWNAARARGRKLLEVPLTLMDGALFRGLALTPATAVKCTISHLEEVERVGGMAGLLWHPNVADESRYPGWWACFTAALDHLAARRAWVTSAGEMAAWWREREARLSGGIA